MAIDAETIRRITIQARIEGVDAAAASLKTLATTQDGLARSGEQASRANLSVEKSYESLQRRVDVTHRAQTAFERDVRTLAQAQAQGLVPQERANELLALAAQRYNQLVTAAGAAARVTQQAAQQSVNSAQSINQRLGVQDSFSSADRQQELAAYGRSLDDIRAKYNPLFAAGRQYRETLTEINQSAKIGAISEKERAAAIESTKVSFVQQVGALRNIKQSTDDATKSTGLARYEMINLGRQGADVFTQLASGQGLFITAVQQGPQVLDIFATSQGRVVDALKSGVGWLGRFATSAAGIATGVVGIGAAAIFAATQFARASATIEQALEEQNRLLKEGKALLDARTSAEARAQLQSKEQTQFEARRNELDLQVKLNAAMEEAARLAASRAGTPTGGGVPEMGIAPTGIAARSDPGYEKIIEAHAKLKGAQEAGLPGIKEFNAELAKVGLAHPELALIVQDMLKAGEAGLELEKSALRAKALSAALGDVATNAQLAALGLGSIAQIQLNNQQANEAREATERQAIAILKIRDNWGGVSIEAAKTLDTLSRQLAVAQAVGAMAQLEAQHRAKVAELSQRMSVSEATRIADYERAVSLAQIEAGHKQQMVALQGQLSVAQQSTGIGQINAQYEATVASLSLQSGQVKAIEQAEMQRAISIAQVNANADQTLRNLQQEGELIRASSAEEEDRIRARQTYQNLVAQGVEQSKAAAVASQQQSNAEEAREKRHQRAAEQAIASIKTRADAWRAFNTEFENTGRSLITWSQANDAAGDILRRQEADAEDAAHAMNALASSLWDAGQAALIANTKFVPFATAWKSLGGSGLGTFGAFQGPQGLSQFDPKGYDFKTDTPQLQFAKNVYGAGGYDQKSMQPNQQGLTNVVNSYLSGGRTMATANWQSGGGITGAIEGILSGAGSSGGVQFGAGGLSSDALQLVQQLTELLPNEQKAGVIERELSILRSQPQNIQTLQAMAQLEQALQQATQATQDNTEALRITTDPLITQGHEYLNNLKIGYYQNENGGIMTKFGKIPLRQYADGGVVSAPSLFSAGENYKPEAIIPLKNGAVPVLNLNPSTNAGNDNRRSVSHQYFGPGSIVVNQRGDASRLSPSQIARGFRPLAA